MERELLSPTTAAVLYTIAEDDVEQHVHVNEGDIIMALESCKVEVPIRATLSGMCKFFVRPGEMVGEGCVLAVIISMNGDSSSR